MSRNTVTMLVLAMCVATGSYSRGSQDPSREQQPFQGLWTGSYGGGQSGGVTFLPNIAELFIKGDHIEISGYPSTVQGTYRLDAKAKKIKIARSSESGGKAPEPLEYGYEIRGDSLTLTDGRNRLITFHKRDVISDPLANAQIELVMAEGVNKAGDLLVTEFTELRTGRIRATSFERHARWLKTKRAAILVVQETGCKRISLNEARGLVRKSMPVVISYRQDDRRPADQGFQLSKEIGPPAADGQAVGRTFSRMLRPGTLVFVLSEKENVPVP